MSAALSIFTIESQCRNPFRGTKRNGESLRKHPHPFFSARAFTTTQKDMAYNHLRRRMELAACKGYLTHSDPETRAFLEGS